MRGIEEVNNGSVLSYENNGLFDLNNITHNLSLIDRFIKKKDWKAVKQINENLIRLELESESNFVSFYPKEISIECTSFSNFQCIMCPHSVTKNSCASHIDDSVVEKLDDILPYCKRVMIQGDGEPFLYPKIKQLILKCASFDVKLAATTNLSIIDTELLELIDENFETLTISCDSGSKELYERIRTNGEFDTFERNLELLSKCVKNTRIVMNSVIMRQNIMHVEELISFAHMHNVHNINFSNLLSMPMMKNQSASLYNFPVVTKYYLDRAKALAEDLNMNLVINWDYCFKSCDEPSLEAELIKINEEDRNDRKIDSDEAMHFIEKYCDLKKPVSHMDIPSGKYKCSGICSNVYEKAYIDAMGNMTLCCFGKLRSIGSLSQEKDFKAIWNNDIYQRVRKMFFKKYLPDYCIGCRYIMNMNVKQMQKHNFYVLGLDEQFYLDSFFWENRDM